MKPLVVVDENIPWVEHYLGEQVQIKSVSGRDLCASDLEGACALLVRSVTRVDQTLLAGTALKFVGSATSGTDHVDIDFLRKSRVAFAYAPGSNANSVVEYVLAVVSAVDDRLEQLLSGGRVGIIGYGVIGKLLASRLASLGIAYCVHDPWLDQSTIEHRAELQEVLGCEVVSLHAELTHRQPWPSFHLLAGPELALIKEGALLINASRGAVVDNIALLDLLNRAEIAPTVVLDVWEGEPQISAELLRRVRSGSPHVAGYSLDGKILATRMLCEKLAECLAMPWSDPGAPVPSPGEIALDGGEDDAAFLRQLLQARYDISSDDSALRAATLDRPAPAAAAAFDRLRREYPTRRELPGSLVRGTGFSARQEAWLKALGCEASGTGEAP